MDEEAKRAFNMKVLKRHDASITEILASASFVVLYSHNEQWTKTGIEGPMFIYERSQSPHYGFFILNRNGVENFSASILAQDDLEITPEFIIYRPEPAEQSDDGEVYGIWIFEQSQRESIGAEMMRLHSSTSSSSSKPRAGEGHAAAPSIANGNHASSSSGGQPISLDALFASSSSGASNPQQLQLQSQSQVKPPSQPQAQHASASNGASASLMDDIFNSARTTQRAQAPPASSPGPLPEPSPSVNAQASSSTPSNAPSGSTVGGAGGIGGGVMDAASSLMSMLGIRSAPAASAPAPAPAPAPVAPSSSASISEAREAKKEPEVVREATPTPNAEPTSSSAAAEEVNGQEKYEHDASRKAVASALGAQKQPAARSEEAMSRRDFVRHLLTLIHTDSEFVDRLYDDYLKEVAAG